MTGVHLHKEQLLILVYLPSVPFHAVLFFLSSKNIRVSLGIALKYGTLEGRDGIVIHSLIFFTFGFGDWYQMVECGSVARV